MQHKNDPLFMEFLESHSADKAIWNNEKILTAIQDSKDSDDDKESSSDDDDEEEKNQEEEGERQKIADKVISDLEVTENLRNFKNVFYILIPR